MEPKAFAAPRRDAPAAPRPSGPTRAWRAPWAPVALAIAFFAFALLPRVHENPRLLATFLAVGAGLAVWTALLAARAGRCPAIFRIEPAELLTRHYVQASLQISLYAYWGWYWRDVYAQIPLIFAQLVFLYLFDALLSWTRGRAWRLGFGPLPIILSTNVFLWFKDDLFAFQFLLVATGALGKELVKWTRDGRRTHVFNPSAFTLAIFAAVLIATGATGEATRVEKIAETTAWPPFIYVYIFALGLVVQRLFAVTLMTLSTAVSLSALGLAYHAWTGTYWFVSNHIPAPVFLGFHLLATDPSTSPRTCAGKVMFGSLYGALIFASYGVLEALDAPRVYDKLLPVPLLNLSVRWMDRLAQAGPFGALLRLERRMTPPRLNTAAMAAWSAIFVAMAATGFVEGFRGPHPGRTYEFWKREHSKGNPYAGRGLREMLVVHARGGSSDAWNELGLLHQEGRAVPRDLVAAARHFAQASALGNVNGSANLVSLFLGATKSHPNAAVEDAFDHLEREIETGGDPSFFSLVGAAYETGRGRPLDRSRARELYQRGCARGSSAACTALSRLARAL